MQMLMQMHLKKPAPSYLTQGKGIATIPSQTEIAGEVAERLKATVC
tara:strand:+ start:511 stop:648 length:138 start_codon:yes stop_codon:yes gene_type:complete